MSAKPFDPERVVRVLAAHGVAYVLIGALGARLHGFPRVTADIDVTPDRSSGNLERLASALRELGARVFTESIPEGLPFDCSAATILRANVWNLVTDAGRMDVAFVPSGTGGYDDLARNAELFEVFDTIIQVASLADIIRSKRAADRPQDRQDVAILEAMLQRRA